MTVKLVAIDVDKTLVDDEKQLHEKVIETIKAASQREVKVVICSGRPLPGLKQILTDLNLANQKDQYVVCFGGSVGPIHCWRKWLCPKGWPTKIT